MDASALLPRLAAVIDAHDWVGLPDLLHPDFTCRLVHTGEAFDREQWVGFNADYPGLERMLVDDLVAELVEVWADVDQQAPEGTRPD